MNYWLIKSEPGTYSIDRFKEEKQTVWDGVRNYAARNNLRTMKKGDLAFFYHSVTEPGIVGIARVVREAYPDPSTTEDWSVVDFSFVKKFKTPMSLAEIKKDKVLAGMDLLRLSRLSVQQVKPAEWDYIFGKLGA